LEVANIRGREQGVVTIIETWESLEDLQVHLSAPHMIAYEEEVKGEERFFLRVIIRGRESHLPYFEYQQ
ncbi:antibiotic biosynthesis monooxygenase, partial [bacterium]|nr:antibiotic biosynthesis monooxygenase [bacterium]